MKAFVQKVYPYSLRWVLFFCSLLGLVWAIAMGVNNFRYTTNANVMRIVVDILESGRQKTFDVILGILYFVTAGIELWALVACIAHKNLLAKPLLLLGPLGVLVAIAVQVVAVIGHFTLKNDRINQCVLGYTTSSSVIINGNPISTSTATSWCNDAWNRGTWSVFAWLIVVIVISILFCSIAMSYARQVADPSLIRTRQTVQPQVYQMQPQQGGYYPPPPHQQQQYQQSWHVPPYPGPPADPANAPQFEKSDYHPQAEWANTSYAPPPGPPSNNTNPFAQTRPERNVIPNSEEDEAWERARTQGVTAHLTGHAAPPRQGGNAV